MCRDQFLTSVNALYKSGLCADLNILPPFLVIEANPALVVKVEILLVRSSGVGMEIDGRVNSIFWSKKMQNMNVTFPREYGYPICLSHSNAICHDGVNSLYV